MAFLIKDENDHIETKELLGRLLDLLDGNSGSNKSNKEWNRGLANGIR